MAAGSEMADFVLVHSAWFGGWCWNKLVPLLAGHGHSVHTPTLTGLGERSHLAHPGIVLQTHVDDVVNMLTYEDLRGVILVGTSSSGAAITAVADRAPDRISAHLPGCLRPRRRAGPVGPDPAAAAPCDGDAGPDRRLRVAAAPDGGTAMGTVRPRGLQVTDEADLTWMLARLRPTPLGHFTSPVRLVPPQRNGRRGPASGAVAGRTR